MIPVISLDTDVMPAELIDSNGSLTWEVPAFKVGHAQATAGAGGPGNAILVGPARFAMIMKDGKLHRDPRHATLPRQRIAAE